MGAAHYIVAVLVFTLGLGAGVGFGNYHSHSNGAVQNDWGEYRDDAREEHLASADEDELSMAQLLERFEAMENAELENKDKPSPHDWISMENIRVYDNQVVISLPHPEWAMYLNTKSMDPVIDATANTIQLVPKKEADIHLGDIVAYESTYHEGVITHRVIELGSDEGGWYAILKGDNNPKQDPGKIRFEQIKRIVVAIIY
jgi:hypothetical protein